MTQRAGPTGSHARRVLTVSVAQALNAFGSGIAPIAVAFALLGDRDGVAKFSAVLAVGALAPVVMTLAGGVLADRGRSPIRTTRVLRCLAGVVQVLLWVGLLHARSSIVVIGGLLFLGEALSSLTLPSSRRMIAEVVEGEELTRAVATQATLVNLARIASPAVAGVLISVVSTEVAILLSAALLQAVGKGVGPTGGGGGEPDAGVVSARAARSSLPGPTGFRWPRSRRGFPGPRRRPLAPGGSGRFAAGRARRRPSPPRRLRVPAAPGRSLR